MPIIQSAIKRMKQTEKRRERNAGLKKDIKSATKSFMAKPTAESYSLAQSSIDTAVKKKLIKKETASRRKSSLSKIAKEAGVKMPSASSTKPKTPTKKPTKTTSIKTTTVKTEKPAKVSKTPAKKPVSKTTTKK